ncbi:protein kinase domain-containing protein [Colletotrichum kahawae]|uniref:Protein kinase domain-containing protein n=1 Tax=Colletotrichum kahawae TaxID=34407 RepID=A0AAD9YB42_COLKA|nr:protein kinase domain-containing protein [Colletotrichum kahawae]
MDVIKERLEGCGVVDELEKRGFDLEQQILGVQHNSKRIKIFAILVLIEEPAYIATFINHGIWDKELPLESGRHTELFSLWKEGHVDHFCQTQHSVLAPVLDFATTEGHYNFDQKIRMPFLDPLKWSQGGANGLVSVVRIHDKHQKWGPRSGPHPLYAIKRFHAGQIHEFYKEREALLRFSWPQPRHDNLIELLLSYEIGPDKFMVFPGANCNLEQFWKITPNKPTFSKRLIWIIQQCQGLADGLCKVHNYGDSQGRHGDIKSRNILFFEDSQNEPGRLVIADFTLMRFHSSNSDATETWIFNNTRTYRPPEVEAPHGTIVSPTFDTWTLGCVYLEFITWHLLGYDAVSEESFQMPDGQRYESFTTARKSDDDGFAPREDKFFYRRRKYWKNDVKWIKYLRENPDASLAVKDVLDLVEHHMLVISPTRRYDMQMVEKRLKNICRKCNKEAEYSRPDPRGSKKPAMIAPRWTEESSKYGRLDKAPNATFMSMNSRSNPDLEYLNRTLGGEFGHPGSQSLHQHVGVANGYLSPPSTGFASGGNTLRLRNRGSLSPKASLTSLSRDVVDVKIREHKHQPKPDEDITRPTSTEQSDGSFNTKMNNRRLLDTHQGSQKVRPRMKVILHTPGERCSNGGQRDGRTTYKSEEQLASWRERLFLPCRRWYQVLKAIVHAAFRRISNRLVVQ